ncbi:FecR family protein [Pedobacter yonginense]|nr:FecR family protein [Pedobacter yonginense]
MNQQQVAELIRKYNDGTLTPDERLALDIWYLKFASESTAHLSAEQEAIAVDKLKSTLPLAYKSTTKKIWPRIFAVAALLAIVFSAILWIYQDKPSSVQYTKDIKPGKTGATLTLANGRIIKLADIKVGQVAIESGVEISKTADGMITYHILANQDGRSGQMNTLETSIGEQAQVKLPDGSLVYLNAASYLKYPSSFAKFDKRRVEFSGEGFFVVAKDKAHPFLVKTALQDVEVLGTQFNINSYAYHPEIKTTLLEGIVKISNAAGISKTLQPGEQASLTNKSVSVSAVETEYVIAWRKGYFMFNNESLEDIMSKLATWYNIKPVYLDPELKKTSFFGSMSKFENISKVLKVMERTGKAHFEIRDNQIIISKN